MHCKSELDLSKVFVNSSCNKIGLKRTRNMMNLELKELEL